MTQDELKDVIRKAREEGTAELDLSERGLTELPPEIGSLDSLQWLSLRGNQLTELPPEIGSLASLQGLHLNANQLTELPPEIGSLASLQGLVLQYNPLDPELDAAYEDGIEGVKKYLLAKARASVVLNESKLILVGEGEVGKTSLLGALRGDEWVENRETTHGVEVDVK